MKKGLENRSGGGGNVSGERVVRNEKISQSDSGERKIEKKNSKDTLGRGRLKGEDPAGGGTNALNTNKTLVEGRKVVPSPLAGVPIKDQKKKRKSVGRGGCRRVRQGRVSRKKEKLRRPLEDLQKAQRSSGGWGGKADSAKWFGSVSLHAEVR